MKDLLRRYPDMAEVVVAQLAGALHDLPPEALAQPDARAAVVWVVGQFGQHIPVGGGGVGRGRIHGGGDGGRLLSLGQ